MKKILILRFSAIGDIVLTSPVIRSLRAALPDAEIHYFTKPAYKDLLIHNPHLDRLHLLAENLSEQLTQLRKEKFDHILDLHNNLRTLRVKRALKCPASTFNKKNLSKYILCQPLLRPLAGEIPHIVMRYGETLHGLNITLDNKGLELFLPDGMEGEMAAKLPSSLQGVPNLLGVVLGAKWATKRWPTHHFETLLNQLGRPVMLIGGPDAREEADYLTQHLKVPYFDAVAHFGLLEAAALMKQCQAVLTHDTGFMHIAAAFGMKTYSLWGNTVPAFGMTPYRTDHVILENTEPGCRPCSKIGHQKCPKGHFRCMEELTPEVVLERIENGELEN